MLYMLHRRRSRVFYNLLNDVKNSVTICFDMMENMVLPKSPIGQSYYSRQLYLYLFGVVVHGGRNSEQSKDDIHMHVWGKHENRKDSNIWLSVHLVTVSDSRYLGVSIRVNQFGCSVILATVKTRI